MLNRAEPFAEELEVPNAQDLALAPALVPVPSAGERRSMARLKMLQSLAAKLNQLNDVAQIGEAITAELRTLIDYHNCRVHLISPDGTLLIPIAFRGSLGEYMVETYDALVMTVGTGVTGHVAMTGEAYYTPDANECEFAVTIPGTKDVDESMLAVPMIYAGRVIGTIVLSKLGIDQFDAEEDLRLLETLASQAGVAIENARLLQSERESATTARELLKLSQALTRVQNLNAVVQEVVAAVPAIIGTGSVLVYIRDPSTGDYRLAGLGGFEPGAGRSIEDVPSIPAQLAARRSLDATEPMIVPRALLDDVPTGHPVLAEARDRIVAPMRWDPDGAGTIVAVAANEDTRYSQRELDLVRGLADITSLALGNSAAFERQREVAEHLRNLDEMKNMFLQAVSHDLRTPLTTVLGSAVTLGNEGLELSADDRRDLLARLIANAKKLARLLTDLLDLDRLIRGILEPNRRSTDVGGLVRRIVSDTDLLQGRHVEVEAGEVTAMVDGPKVERIVENLLANAARHTPPGTSVWIRVAPEPGGVLIVVEDDGPGVPPDFRDVIFEPFRQGPEVPRHSPGVGVGLSLVARFAELHGGRAWAEPRPGRGASFKVYLPSGIPVEPEEASAVQSS